MVKLSKFSVYPACCAIADNYATSRYCQGSAATPSQIRWPTQIQVGLTCCNLCKADYGAYSSHTLNTYRGLLGTVGTVAKEEGASALWKGLEPGAMNAAPTLRHLQHPTDVLLMMQHACMSLSMLCTRVLARCVQGCTGNVCLVG